MNRLARRGIAGMQAAITSEPNSTMEAVAFNMPASAQGDGLPRRVCVRCLIHLVALQASGPRAVLRHTIAGSRGATIGACIRLPRIIADRYG